LTYLKISSSGPKGYGSGASGLGGKGCSSLIGPLAGLAAGVAYFLVLTYSFSGSVAFDLLDPLDLLVSLAVFFSTSTVLTFSF